MATRKILAELKNRLVDGLRVLTGEEILSGSGHLSVRIPGTETFLINPRFAGVLADPKDICTVTFEGKRIAGKGPCLANALQGVAKGGDGNLADVHAGRVLPETPRRGWVTALRIS